MRHKAKAGAMTGGMAIVEVLIANSRVVKDTVRSGGADVGVGAFEASEQVDGLESELLVADELVVAVPMSHPWSRGFPIDARELLRHLAETRDPEAVKNLVDAWNHVIAKPGG